MVHFFGVGIHVTNPLFLVWNLFFQSESLLIVGLSRVDDDQPRGFLGAENMFRKPEFSSFGWWTSTWRERWQDHMGSWVFDSWPSCTSQKSNMSIPQKLAIFWRVALPTFSKGPSFWGPKTPFVFRKSFGFIRSDLHGFYNSVRWWWLIHPSFGSDGLAGFCPQILVCQVLAMNRIAILLKFCCTDFYLNHLFFYEVADLSPIHLRKQTATDGTKLDLNIGETRVWLWFRAKSTTLFYIFFENITVDFVRIPQAHHLEICSETRGG